MQSHHPPPEEGVGEDEDVDAMVMEEDGVERPCLEVKFSFLEWLPLLLEEVHLVQAGGRL
jgi:hypothetical protein